MPNETFHRPVRTFHHSPALVVQAVDFSPERVCEASLGGFGQGLHFFEQRMERIGIHARFGKNGVQCAEIVPVGVPLVQVSAYLRLSEGRQMPFDRQAVAGLQAEGTDFGFQQVFPRFPFGQVVKEAFLGFRDRKDEACSVFARGHEGVRAVVSRPGEVEPIALLQAFELDV